MPLTNTRPGFALGTCAELSCAGRFTAKYGVKADCIVLLQRDAQTLRRPFAFEHCHYLQTVRDDVVNIQCTSCAQWTVRALDDLS